MPLSQLLEALEHDAREEARRVTDASRAEAEAILERARMRAAELAEKPARDARAAAGAEAERVRARARSDRAAALRATREDAVQDALEEVACRLERLREREDHPQLLRVLADEARELLPTAELLDVDARDVPAVRALADEWAVRIQSTYSGWGGVVLADGRGRAVRNTLEERFASATPRARAIVASQLAREESP